MMEQSKKKSGSMFDGIYIAMLAVLLVVAVFYIGKPRVGIIHLGKVAAELGVEEKIIEDAQQWRESAANDFRKLKEEYQTVGKGIQAEAAEVQTDEERLALRANLQEATRDYYKSSAKVRARVRKHQQRVLQTFRNRLDPFITEVARKRRLWLVLDSSARLVYATSRIDISDDVVDSAREFFSNESNLLDDELTEDDLPQSVLEANDSATMEQEEGDLAE